MERQKKIIDASVVVKWFVKEEGTNEALEIRNKHLLNEILLVVPDLIFIEIINALKYKNHDENFLQRTNKVMFETKFHVEKTNQIILNKAIELSIKYNLSIYDGLYAALSEVHECELITSDKKLGKIPNTIVI